MNNLVIGLMVVYFFCAYFIGYKFAMLVFTDYSISVKWYHKAASTYVLALPIFLLLVYLIGKVRA